MTKNSQLMFSKFEFFLGMLKPFGLDQKQIFSLNFTFRTMSKLFWYPQNEIGYPKH